MHELGELMYWPTLAEATPFQGNDKCMLAQKIAISLLRNGGAICRHPACLGMFFAIVMINGATVSLQLHCELHVCDHRLGIRPSISRTSLRRLPD